MEKRLKNTLARTVNLGAKAALTAVLLVPAYMTAQRMNTIRPSAAPEIRESIVPAGAVNKPQPRELVRIYSVVRETRPDVSDAYAWKVASAVLAESARRDLDPMLVLAVIKIESRFDHRAISPVGARGIMQIMPETAKFLTEELVKADGFKIRSFQPHFLDDPALNIKLGVFYLNDLKRQFRNLNLALMAYNVGPSEIQNRLENKITFSAEYANLVLGAYREYKKIKTPML